jgi:Domain of unknown function (DUF4190)/Protein of unknown function (DUF2510)
MSTNGPDAGWLTDPEDSAQQRYSNGVEWTEHRIRTSPQPPGSMALLGYPSAPQSSSGATTALVLGILSLVFLGFLTGIPAMVTARRATREIDQSQGRIGGRGMATAGFVTGLIGTIWSALAFGLVVLVFLLGGALNNTFDSTCSTISSDPFSGTGC